MKEYEHLSFLIQYYFRFVDNLLSLKNIGNEFETRVSIFMIILNLSEKKSFPCETLCEIDEFG